MNWVELAVDVYGIGKKGKYGYVCAYNQEAIDLIGTHSRLEVGVIFEGLKNTTNVPVWALVRSYNKRVAAEIENMINNSILTKDVAVRICKKYKL
nr:hypothetical protein [uncultured Allomuricauda sp.]